MDNGNRKVDGTGWKRFRLKEKKNEADGVKSFIFESTETQMYFLPGQHVIIRFPDLEGDQRGKMRHFSISTSPLEGKYIGITTSIEPMDSPFKRKLDSLDRGEEVDVFGAIGKFIFEPSLWKERIIVLVAGGIGITPFRSMIKYALSMNGNFRIRLLYSGKTSNSLIFRKELDGLATGDSRLKIFYTVTGEPEGSGNLHRGRVDQEFIRANVEELDNAMFYICGPPRMVDEETRVIVSDLGVDRNRIRTEQFLGY